MDLQHVQVSQLHQCKAVVHGRAQGRLYDLADDHPEVAA